MILTKNIEYIPSFSYQIDRSMSTYYLVRDHHSPRHYPFIIMLYMNYFLVFVFSYNNTVLIVSIYGVQYSLYYVNIVRLEIRRRIFYSIYACVWTQYGNRTSFCLFNSLFWIYRHHIYYFVYQF